MLQQAAEWLASILAGNEGVPVTYARVGETSIAITVVPGRVRPERHALADGRVNLELEPADFLVRAELLDFGDGPVEPRTGDRITLAGRTYELFPRDGEPSWRCETQYPVTDAGGAPVARCPSYRLRTIRVKAV